MTVARLAYLLRMVGGSFVCVIEEGRLLGVLTRINLFECEPFE